MNYLLEGSGNIAKEFEEEHRTLLASSGGESGKTYLSRADVNLFVGLVSYMKVRLKHYMRFCMICHARHQCQSD